jgi:hypothetical protein
MAGTTARRGIATGSAASAINRGAALMAIAAARFAVLMLAVKGMRAGQVWAWGTAVATPVLALAVALPAHYPWNLDTLGHLGLIYLAVVIFVAGAALSGKGLFDTKRAGTRP